MDTNSVNILKEFNQTKAKIEGLDIALRTMSTEDHDNFIDKMSIYFVSKLNNIKGFMQAGSNFVMGNLPFSSEKEMNAYVKELRDYNRPISNIIKKANFSAIRTMEVYTIIGLRTNLVDASETLFSAYNILVKDTSDALDDLDTFVSNIVADKDFRTATREQKPNTKLKDVYTKLEKNLEKVIDPKKLNDTARIEDVIPNLNSLQIIYDNIMNVSDGFVKNNLVELSEVSDSLYEKTNLLVEQMKDKGEYSVSKPVLNKLAVDIEYGAKLITIIASYHFLYNQLTSVFKVIVDKINKVK